MAGKVFPFNPSGGPVGIQWKPNSGLVQLALRRCTWINDAALQDIKEPEEWLATVVVSCYYQGVTDGVKHMVKKQREAAKEQAK